jgi:pyridoxal phosphate enzyme (YggS family)
VSRLAENIDRVKARFAAAAKDHQNVTLVAVSKTRSADEIRAAHLCGLSNFGENYLQEALPKIQSLGDYPITWHFIGPIQSNKTKEIAEHFDWAQTVDRLKIARRLSDQRNADRRPLQICLQVNIDGEASKSGLSPADVLPLAEQIVALPNLQLRGLMAIPAPQGEYADQFAVCQRMVQLFSKIRNQIADIDTLSLGMSADLEAAIASGSTMVRIGTDIFGPRNQETKI